MSEGSPEIVSSLETYKFKISASEVQHTQKAKLSLFLLPSSFVLLPPLFSFAGHFILAFILEGNFFRKTFRIIGLDGLGSAAGKWTETYIKILSCP